MKYILIVTTSEGGIFPPVFSDSLESLQNIMVERIREFRDCPEHSIISKSWGWAQKEEESRNFQIYEIPNEVFFIES